MKKLLAGLVATAFATVSVPAFAADAPKPVAAAAKKAETKPAAKKEAAKPARVHSKIKMPGQRKFNN